MVPGMRVRSLPRRAVPWCSGPGGRGAPGEPQAGSSLARPRRLAWDAKPDAVAASARAAGWDAAVLQGLPALRLARAGDHRLVAPEAAAHGASGAQVAALFETFLAAGGRGLPVQSAASSRSLAVTP